jgi:FG-GAP repeat
MSNRGFVRAALAAAGSLLVVVAPAADAPVRRTRVAPSEPAAQFGNAVALDGPTLVVGAKASGESGEVIVLERSALDPDRWAEVARFAQDGLNQFDFFGGAVAVSGNAFVVATDSLGANPGAWVYQRNDVDGTWTEIQELQPEFGPEMVDPAGVAIHGNIAAVGDPGDNASTGAVYLFNRFSRGATRWHLLGRLIPAGALPGTRFGTSVAFDGRTLVTGAIGDGALGQEAGAAYVYKRVPSGEGPPWTQVARLAPADLHPFARFGSSVDVADDTIVVGARGKVLAGVSAGAAYVFERDLGGADNWGQAARLDPTNFDSNDAFGGSVAVRGDRVLVGAPGDDDLCPENPDPEAPDCNHGAAYFFHRVPGGAGVWGLVEKFHAPQGVFIHDTEQFGEAVDLDGTSAVVGGPGRDNAYVYRLLFPPR